MPITDPLYFLMLRGEWFTLNYLAARVKSSNEDVLLRLQELSTRPGIELQTQAEGTRSPRLRLLVAPPVPPKKRRSAEPVEDLVLTRRITRCTHCSTPTQVDGAYNALERFFCDDEPGLWREVCPNCGQRYDVKDSGEDA